MKIQTKLLCAAILLFSTVKTEAQISLAQVSLPTNPTKTWKVLETKHFEIIYDVENKKLAESFANEAERAASFLEPILKILPKDKTPLVVADITDSSNGEALAIPRSQIEIYPVLPAVSDSTSEYYNWVREVITHEFTHILNFEPTSGFMSVLKFVFGTIIRPGGYLPRWYLEGLAVEMESRLTPVGRGRSHYYDAFIRAQVEGDVLRKETVDRINPTSIPTWPRGSRPYTYGYYLMHELSELPRINKQDENESIYYLLDTRYGGRIPWFLNAPMEDYFGMNLDQLLDRTYTDLEKKVHDQLDRLKGAGAIDGKRLTDDGYFNYGAQISPDKLKLAAIVSRADEIPGIRIWTRSKSTDQFVFNKELPTAVINGKEIHQLSWRADSKHIVFDRMDLYRHFSTFNDLYEVDTTNGKEDRLTEGLRAREATVMPDNSLIFVAATSSKTQLMRANSDGKNTTLLYSPADGDRLSSPRPFGDGVIYSHRDSKGHEWIESYSLKTKHLSILTRARNIGEIHSMPAPSPRNPQGFYYAASYSGVMNIYYSDPKHTEPITNVTTYAMSPVVDPDTGTLIFSQLAFDGFELASTPIKHTSLPLANIPGMQNYPAADESDAPKAQIESEHSYSSSRYLWPQYVFPFIYFVPGGALVEVSTSGSDPLNHQQYTLNLGYDTKAQQPLESIGYTNSTLGFNIDAQFANQYTYLVGANIVEHITYGYLDTRHYLFPDTNKWSAGPEFQYLMTDYSPYMFVQFGPGVGISYNNVLPPRDYQISPEQGESLNLGFDYFLPEWGNTSFGNFHGSGSLYLSGKLLPKHHVISLKGSAWVSPHQDTILTGTQQGGGEYLFSLLSPYYLVRGYPVGEFVGYEMYVGNFEYRFPISRQYSGSDIRPVFFNSWHGALICDAITFRGGFYDANSGNRDATHIGTFYVGAGGEVRSDLQVFYGIPVTMRLGAYYGATADAYGGLTYFIGFGSVQ